MVIVSLDMGRTFGYDHRFMSHKGSLMYMSKEYQIHRNWFRQNVLRWRHNERDSVSNQQPRDCLLNSLFRRRSKKTWKLRVTGLCAGTGEFHAQMASNTENVSIWWRHHGMCIVTFVFMSSYSKEFMCNHVCKLQSGKLCFIIISNISNCQSICTGHPVVLANYCCRWSSIATARYCQALPAEPAAPQIESWRYDLYMSFHTQKPRPVSQIRAPPGGLSGTSGKVWQNYSNCYMFWT